MFALRLESVFVGDVVDGVPNVSNRVDIAEATADDKALVLLTGVHHLGRFLMGVAIGKLITELISIDTDIVQRRLLHDYSLAIVWLCRFCKDDSDDGSKDNNLKYNKII